MKSRFSRWKYQVAVPTFMQLAMSVFGDRDRQKDKGRGMFFIMGSGRNGSTLLASLINNQEQLFSPPEQYVVPYFGMKWQLNRRQSITDFKFKLAHRFSKSFTTSNWDLSHEELMTLLNESDESYSQMIRSVFLGYGSKYGKHNLRFVGDNSPLTTHLAKSLYCSFSNSKFIILVRDPRDVVLSYSKMSEHQARQLDYAIWKWKDSIQQYDWLLSKKAQVFLLKYEDLVSFPEKMMLALCAFLGVDFSMDLINVKSNTRLLGVETLSHHQNLTKPINTDSIGRWKVELPDEKVNHIERKLQPFLKRFNYEVK